MNFDKLYNELIETLEESVDTSVNEDDWTFYTDFDQGKYDSWVERNMTIVTKWVKLDDNGEYVFYDEKTLGADKALVAEATGRPSEEDAEYRGRKVTLNKPMRGDVKKFKVYVKDPKTGNVKKVNFGHGGTSAKRRGEKTMKIRKSNPKARKSFRARHNCDNPGPKTKARYWSCKKW